MSLALVGAIDAADFDVDTFERDIHGYEKKEKGTKPVIVVSYVIISAIIFVLVITLYECIRKILIKRYDEEIAHLLFALIVLFSAILIIPLIFFIISKNR